MRNGFLGCVVILAGVGVAAAQPTGPMPALPFVMAPPLGMPYGQPPQPAMPYMTASQPGVPYGLPPQAGMPYGLPPSPTVPFVMPPPPGIPYAPPPGMMTPPMPPQGMQGPMLPPPYPDGPMGGADPADGEEGSNDRPHLSEHMWVEADFLVWWLKHAQTPTLLTTGSPTDVRPGALGQPGTKPLFGGDIPYDALPGGHLDFGFWVAEENGYRFGLQGDLFYLKQATSNFSTSSSGDTVLAQPFYDVVAGQESSSLLAFPNLQSGQYTAALSSRIWGAEVETREEDVDTGVIHIDSLVGLRYLEVLENLDTTESTVFGNGNPLFNGLAIGQSDHFAAGNFFYGAEIGADGTIECGPASFRLLGKVAFGATHQEITISGGTTSSTPLGGSTAATTSGFLALPTNTGRFSREVFTIVPEGQASFGYALTKHIQATIGYNFLFISDVLRPGDQIDHALNTTQVPPPIGPGVLTGPPRPAFTFNGQDFWAQGLNLGLEIRY